MSAAPPDEMEKAGGVRLRDVLVLLLWTVPVALAVGSASALFLRSLDLATASRFAHPWLLYFLPFAGLGIGFLYHTWGRSAEGGNNLIFDQIHEAGEGVPRRMAPLIFFTTVVTHWFGGSAGREGTAVQIGGSLASGLGKWAGLGVDSRRLLLMAGIAAGFGAIFGTPFAGVVFALEVLLVGRLSLKAVLPCFVASFLADLTCHAWGAAHTLYAVTSVAGEMKEWFQPVLLGQVAVTGVAAGLAAALFAEMTHGLHGTFAKVIPYAPLRPFVGGLLIIGLTFAVGTREYLGLGVTSPNPEDMTISTFFLPRGGETWAWFWKILFTALTLSCGFKGGEVTPLFFIGAALGYTLSGVMNGPVDLLAAVGFVAIFAGATNTPIASTIMGMELFGMRYGPYLALGCGLAFLCSGLSGIYLSQRVGHLKRRCGAFPPGTSLRQLREGRQPWLRRIIESVRNARRRRR